MQSAAAAFALRPDAPLPPRGESPRDADPAFARLLDSNLRARADEPSAPSTNEEPAPVEPIADGSDAPAIETRSRDDQHAPATAAERSAAPAETPAPRAEQNVVVLVAAFVPPVPPVPPAAPPVTPIVAAPAARAAIAAPDSGELPPTPAPLAAPIAPPPVAASVAPAPTPPAAPEPPPAEPAALTPAAASETARAVAPAQTILAAVATKLAEPIAPRIDSAATPLAADLDIAASSATPNETGPRVQVIRPVAAPSPPIAPATGLAAQLAPADADTTPAGEHENAAVALVDRAARAPEREALRPRLDTATSDALPTVAPLDSAPRVAASPEAALRAIRAGAHPAIAQVAVHVVRAAADGVDRITIKLEPPELGRIDVKLDIGVDGRISAVFAADRAATLDVLRRDAVDLERALQSAGLSADSSSLQFGLRDQNRSAPEQGNGGGDVPRDVAGDDQPPPPPWRVRAGGVDIRV